ncbi:HAMP domain-containing protein [candidate division KSB3 bacterium]|uniref:HAMP domain-containing protein n=1 Tax=candidate division KSB3 bacterium TaxID=2044937 RepID=A0A9D5Q5P8_9BACT|nr:HAMP domain-containing protein [candidate division KSB3 bacterium]MBD3324855.1 HAMP domain-containing protein [candidate division KSB3 bacterium]
MKRNRRLVRWTIVTKLIVVCLVIFGLVGGIVAIDLLSFQQVERLLMVIIDKDVAEITENASLSRDLSHVFADTNLLIGTFIDRPDYVHTERTRLLEMVEQNLVSSAARDNEQLQDLLHQFAQQLQLVLEQCTRINDVSKSLALLHTEAAERLRTLESLISENMATIMMEGREDELFTIEQLNAMLPRYRETFSHLQFHLAESKREPVRVQEADAQNDHEQQIFTLLQDLSISLTSIMAAGEDFAAIGDQLFALVDQYRERSAAFHQLMDEFKTSVVDLKPIQMQVLAEMETIDAQIVQTTSLIKEEVTRAIQSSQKLMMGISAIILLILLGVGYYAVILMKPLGTLAHTAERMAEGEVDGKIPATTSQDEIGTLARAFTNLMTYIQEMAAVATDIAQGKLSRDIQPRSDRDLLGHAFLEMSRYLNEIASAATSIAAGDLRQDIQPKTAQDILGNAFQQMQSLRNSMREILAGATQLSSASEELTQISTQMASSTEETSHQLDVVASSSQKISENVDAVAVSTEEFSSNIVEIAKNTDQVAHVAGSAVEIATSANTIIADLEARSQEINEVIQVITDITQQTNLLALNATIEAARAGDAGKGFAVVANEIKELSRETAVSTEDIIQKLEAIRNGSDKAMQAITNVSDIIGRIRDLSTAIASGVEQQSVTTQEMTHRMSEAARGSQDITQVIGEIVTTARHTSEGAVEVQHAARDLASLADNLHHLVARFKV